MLNFDPFLSEYDSGPVSDQCVPLKKAPHPVLVFRKSQTTWRKRHWKPGFYSASQISGKPIVSHQPMSFRRLGGYLAALEHIIKYFSACHLLSFSCLKQVNIAKMDALEKDDPSTWEALKTGKTFVAKSEYPFINLFTDQAFKQEIKGLKQHGGVVGLTQDAEALDRLVTTTPHLAHIAREYLNSFLSPSKATLPI